MEIDLWETEGQFFVYECTIYLNAFSLVCFGGMR